MPAVPSGALEAAGSAIGVAASQGPLTATVAPAIDGSHGLCVTGTLPWRREVGGREMLRFLFWNTGRRPVQAIIADLARSNDVDVLVLAECAVPPEALLEVLRAAGFHPSPGRECKRIAIHARFAGSLLEPVFETVGATVRRLCLPDKPEILLAAAHLPSKLRWSRESQAAECFVFAEELRRVEQEAGHTRTVLVGDLNLDPFEAGLVAASGLNAAMTRQLAGRGSRTVQGREYPFFYNPMWGLFGDGTPGPPGTYYYEGSEHVATFWHIFDQVLVRPELMGLFRNDSLRVLDGYDGTSLVTDRGLPDKANASDHLPVLFELDL